MRDTAKTILFDFSFRFPSKDGGYDEANCITVCEPGFKDRGVFRRMGGYVAEASKGLMKLADGKSTAAVEAEVGAAKEQESDPDSLLLMRMGLSIEAYETFAKYVEGALTNNTALAYVGSDPEKKTPVTAEAWMNIAAEGGLEQMDRVIGEFTGFFFGTRPAPADSPMTTGTEKPSSSPARPMVGSRTTKH